MKKLTNPKKISDQDLWWIIQNVFPKYAPKELQKWYAKIKKEFYARKIKMKSII